MVAKLSGDEAKISGNFLEGGVNESELESGCAVFFGIWVCIARIRGNMRFSILRRGWIYGWVWLLVGRRL